MKAAVKKTGPYAMRVKKEDPDLTWLWECQRSVYQADKERSIPDRKRHVSDKTMFLEGTKSKCSWGIELPKRSDQEKYRF